MERKLHIRTLSIKIVMFPPQKNLNPIKFSIVKSCYCMDCLPFNKIFWTCQSLARCLACCNQYKEFK